MSFIKHLFNSNKQEDNTSQKPHEINQDNKYISILNLGLLHDGSVDISVELNNIHVNEKNLVDEANKIAAFLHILCTGGLSVNIANILVQQIGSDHRYSTFIDEVIKLWVIYQAEYDKAILSSVSSNIDTPVIKPTEVFGQYYSNK